MFNFIRNEQYFTTFEIRIIKTSSICMQKNTNQANTRFSNTNLTNKKPF